MPATKGKVHFVAQARKLLEDRQRHRVTFGNSGLFGDHAWDIFLDIFVKANEEPTARWMIGQSPLPEHRTVRWLRALEAEGLVVLEENATARLSNAGEDKMMAYLEGR